jgi:hypothetical protein
MLRRMVSRKEIKLHDLSKFSLPDMFMLNSTHRLKSTEKFLHEKAGADLFVTYKPYMKRWAFEPFIKSRRADRGMQFENITVYFEVDRATENIQELFDKIDNYIQYSREAEKRFHVIFALVGDSAKVNKRGNKIIPYLKEIRRGDQFLMVNHQRLIDNPFGKVIYSPRDEIIALNDLL